MYVEKNLKSINMIEYYPRIIAVYYVSVILNLYRLFADDFRKKKEIWQIHRFYLNEGSS